MPAKHRLPVFHSVDAACLLQSGTVATSCCSALKNSVMAASSLCCGAFAASAACLGLNVYRQKSLCAQTIIDAHISQKEALSMSSIARSLCVPVLYIPASKTPCAGQGRAPARRCNIFDLERRRDPRKEGYPRAAALPTARWMSGGYWQPS